jgi:hypothetical protein
MVRFFVIELTYLGLNLRFNVSVTYLWLIIFLVVDDVSSTVKHFFINFVNLKIKSVQYLRGCA